MLRMSNRNRKKSSKANSSNVKSNNKKIEYVEESNEIILNELVPEERRQEFGMEEAPQRPNKKKGGLTFNLGLNKKKSAKSESSKEKNSNDKSAKKESNKDAHSDSKTSKNNTKDSSKGKNSNKESAKSNGKSSKQEKSSSGNKGKHSGNVESSKPNPKKKGSNKNQSTTKNEKVDDNSTNTNVEEKTNHKSNSKKSTGVKRKKVHEDEYSIQKPLREIEDYVPIDFDIEDENDNKSGFRSDELTNYESEYTQENNNKLKDLVWSEDKFPKK